MNAGGCPLDSAIRAASDWWAAVLRAMQETPRRSVADVDELDAAIAADRLPSGHAISFQTDPIVIYLFDTNTISALMRAEARMASWLASIGVDDRVVICTITRGEFLNSAAACPLMKTTSG